LINCFLSKKDDYNLESGQGGIQVYLVIYTRLVWHVVYDLPCHLTSKLDKKTERLNLYGNAVKLIKVVCIIQNSF